MNQSESIKELATALAKAQGQIEGAKKDSLNPHFKNRYADLASVWEACRKQLSSNGLSVVQLTEGGPDTVTIITRLMHESGEWMESALTLRPTKPDAQGIGSAVTYGRRYGLMAMVGIAPEDDDAQAASQPVSTPQATSSAPNPVGLKNEISKLVRGKPPNSIREAIGFNWADCDDPNKLANAIEILKAG